MSCNWVATNTNTKPQRSNLAIFHIRPLPQNEMSDYSAKELYLKKATYFSG